ncbi:metal-sulfur cluster assembly factor, partial [Streptococcus suis]
EPYEGKLSRTVLREEGGSNTTNLLDLDIYNLGLVYEIHLDETGFCKVVMTFTDSGCSCADTMPGELVTALKTIDGINDAQVEIVWSPAWKMTRISRLGRITLGISPK